MVTMARGGATESGEWNLEVLEMAARGRPVSEVLDALVRSIERSSDAGAIGSVLLMDAGGQRLRHGAAPGLPPVYCKAIDGLEIGPRAGSCGTAAFAGETVIVSDITTDPLWADYRALAVPHGLRACWSTPIKSAAGMVLGTFAMYYREARAPSARDRTLVERACGIASILLERDRADRELRETETRYRQLIELSPDTVFVHADWRIVLANQAMQRMFGAARPDDVIGKEVLSLVAPDSRELVRLRIAQLYKEPTAVPTVEVAYLRMDGSRFVAEVTASPFSYAGRPAAQVVARDITERKRVENALRESEARFRALTSLSSDWYWETDAELRFTYVSEGYRRVRGRDPATLVGKRRWELGPTTEPEAMDKHRADMEARRPFVDFSYSRRAPSGEVTSTSHSGEPVFDELGAFTGYRGVARDITQQKRTEEDLARLAHYDTLTGLPNRALLQDRIRQAMARADRNETLLGVMFLDLDQFKEINDSLGHAFGDQVLKLAAERLQSCLRSTDTVARLGGDEFTVLVEGAREADEIRDLAKKILKAVRKRAPIGAQELYLSTSIGITVYPLDGRDPEALLRNADLAMYQAKQEGRNALQFFAQDMSARSETRRDIQSRLRRALANKEFTLHYQPQVEIASGRVVGLEALLRWQSAELGSVSPAQFIPIAEETGLILQIGEWVLREACRQCKVWLDAGYGPLSMAVNLSPRQFRQKDLVKSVHAILEETGLAAGCLDLEITESTAMYRADAAIDSMRELRALGVQISVDDFGTGYSSLAYLQRFPVRTLKVDQSFVRDIQAAGEGSAIVSTVIELARLLRLKSLAEGVETAEQLAFLRSHNCTVFQGYYFCKPLPAAELQAILQKHAREGAPPGHDPRLQPAQK